MSEQVTQGAEATSIPAGEVVELEGALSSVAEQSFSPSTELNANTETQPNISETTAEPLAKISTSNKLQAFVERQETNLTYYRRQNGDGRHHFDIVESTIGWEPNKGTNNVAGTPIGTAMTELLIQLLTVESWKYIATLTAEPQDTSLEEQQDGEAEGKPDPDTPLKAERPRDPGDVTNLERLFKFTQERGERFAGEGYDPLYDLLRVGLRSINLPDRIIENAVHGKGRYVNGTVTISYQIQGEETIYKYRVVGRISREFICSIAEAGGNMVKEVLQPHRTEAKKKKIKKEEVKSETTVKPEGDVEIEDAQPTSHANAPITPDYPVRGQAPARQDNKESKRRPTDAPLSHRGQDHVTHYLEALIADNRQLGGAVRHLTNVNQTLQKDVRDAKETTAKLQASVDQLMALNKTMMSALNSILTEVSR